MTERQGQQKLGGIRHFSRNGEEDPYPEMEYKVSVIIPCYNQAHFLGDAIESVLSQTYRNFEVIVVDDGSSDNTSEVASGYEEVRLIRQKNKGLASARNTGLSYSSGSYLLFLDADDQLLSDALEVHLQSFNAHPECAFVSGHYRKVSADGSPLPTGKQPQIENNHYAEIIRCNYRITPAVVMYRRAVVDLVGGFNASPSVRGSEDADLCMRIARGFPVHCHGKEVALYRDHGTSMSHNSALMLKATITVRRSQRKFVKGNEQYEEAIKEGISVSQDYYGWRLVSGLRTHAQSRQWKQITRGIVVLVRYYPRGLALLLMSERGIERHKLIRRLEDGRQALTDNERRLNELADASYENEDSFHENGYEGASLATERNRLTERVRWLRGHIRALERRIEKLDLDYSDWLLEERRRVARQLHAHKGELRVRRRRFEHSKATKERLEVQRLRENIRESRRRIQSLDRQKRSAPHGGILKALRRVVDALAVKTQMK